MDMEKELGMINQEREIEREIRDRGYIYNMIYNICVRRYLVGFFIYSFVLVRLFSMVIRICVELIKFSFFIIKFI